ncbi:hypothetical protein HPP92_025122 [Vanilla planifolia]|uniref:DNA mismatch repair protein MutS clamp domain-containing protein n=1 Tax=Vanilla planifolia TaxID=51239 RepID=A0A835UA48_VANPL|nr:hypothetical protein HPP92_025122 [Vanilla planifolia]
MARVLYKDGVVTFVGLDILKGNTWIYKLLALSLARIYLYPSNSISYRIGDIIDEDVVHARAPFVACTQQCFAVKAKVDGLLDVARRSFCDTSEAIYDLASTYREEFNLPNLKIRYNTRQGFYFSIPQRDILGKLPEKFIQVMRNGKNIHCSSFELASAL